MPTIGSRRCGIRATASHWLGGLRVAPARVAIDRDSQGPSHDGEAFRACSSSCWPYEALSCLIAMNRARVLPCPPASCLSTALTAATGSLAVSPKGPWRTRTVRPSIISQLVRGSASRRGRIT